MSDLKFKEKAGYGCGDIASCLYFGIFMHFLTYFYTDVYGISAAAVATMLLVSRTWDWINDPIMGVIADRTRSRMGKFRPWLVWMILPYVVIGILTFTTFDLGNTGKLVYAYITYTALMMVYTAINVPYSALIGAMTSKSGDRTTLATYRMIGGYAGTLFVSLTMLELVELFGQGNEQRGFTLTVALYGIMAAGFFLLTFKSTRERVSPPQAQDATILKELKTLCKNGPWVILIIISILSVIGIAVRSGATLHYFKYVAGDVKLGGWFISISMGVQIIGALFTKHLITLLGGKRRTYVTINVVSAILLAVFYFIPANHVGLIMTHQAISCLVLAPMTPLFWSMIADTADYGVVKLKQSSRALLFSAGTFSQKIGWSIGPSISLALLAFYGFEANQDQSEATLHGLRLLMSWIPACFAILTVVAVYFYKIDSAIEQEVETAMSELEEDSD